MIKQSCPRLLLTRPLAQSRRFAAQMADFFAPQDVVIAPLFQARFLPCDLPRAGVAVLFTSETGVAGAVAAGHDPAGQTAYCVGGRTAQAARDAGYRARDAQGDWRDLAALVQAEHPPGPLALFCASEAPSHLETALNGAGYRVQRHVVYTQDILPLTDAARSILAQDAPVVLPVFSPRAARVLAQSVQDAAAPLWVAAISQASLDAFAAPHARSAIADRPNASAMQVAIQALLGKL